MRLPTVKLIHKRTKKKLIVNQTQYASNIAKYSDYELMTMRRGNASDDVVVNQKREEKIEAHRQNDAERQKWSGDAERQYEQRQGRPSITTSEPEQDWSAMKWSAARKYIKEKTGTFPKSKKHAAELMAAPDPVD